MGFSVSVDMMRTAANASLVKVVRYSELLGTGGVREKDTMASQNSLTFTFDLLKVAQRSVLVTFGSVAIVSHRAAELRRAYVNNDRVHANHKLAGLDPVEIHLIGIIDLLAGEAGEAGSAIQDSCTSYLVTAFHVLSPDVSVTSYSPLFKYFRHVRNAFAHGGRVSFGDRRSQAVGPASWRDRVIGLNDEGNEIWPNYIGFPSALFLVEDAFKERYPAAAHLIPRLSQAG